MPRYADDVKISTTISIALATFSFTGCGSSTRAPAPGPGGGPSGADSSAALDRADLLAGDEPVAREQAKVTWLRPGPANSALFGVAAVAAPVVWVVDDAPPEQPHADRHLVVWRYQADSAQTCEEKPGDPEGLVFSCDEGAGGTKFWRNGEVLDVEEWTGSSGPDQVHLTPAEGQPAPELEAADRQFDAEVAKGGATAWAAWFADDGVQWWETKAIRGHEQILAEMTPVLESTDLRWTPTVSRMLADGFGVTSGTSTSTPRDGSEGRTGVYVTLWRKDPQGWRIVLDTGRTDR
jgi:ketosteroid isomerase-like protein